MKDKTQFSAWKISFFALTLVVVIGVIAWFQLARYEEGVLDIYATQQDAYVQLVIDQINLVTDRSSTEIIENILGTLDASSNQYWTLSEADALVFVKDVMETNKYRGFTTSNYFVSQDAQNFIESISFNKVTHNIIEFDNRRFIISGAKFLYNGMEYRICLLTSGELILDHNAYLSAKVNISLLLIIFLSVFVVTDVVLAQLLEHWKKEYRKQDDEVKELRNIVQKLSDELVKNEMYDTRLVVFQEKVLPILFNKLENKNIWPVAFILLKSDSEKAKERFLLECQSILDKKVLRFALGEGKILLISIHSTRIADDTALEMILGNGTEMKGRLIIDREPPVPLQECYERFQKRMV